MARQKTDENTILSIDTSILNKAPETTRTAPRKSRKKITLKEFALYENLRPEFIAGFKIWLDGQYFFFRDEWKEKLEEYKNRKL